MKQESSGCEVGGAPGVVDVSVVVPAHNRQTLLDEALASVAAAAVRVSVEVIVVDDGSRIPLTVRQDASRVRCVRLDVNQGSSVARNVGIDLAVGRYLKFLDSDDVLAMGSLDTEVELADRSQADIVASGWRNTEMLPDGGTVVQAIWQAPAFSEVLLDDLLAGHAVPTSAALYRTAVVREVRWDPRLSKLNDWGYFVRATLASTRVHRNPAVAYDMRSHQGERITTSSSIEKGVSDFYTILDELVDAIAARGQLTAPRRRRAAQYLYKELRRLYRFDARQARRRLAVIRDLDPHFVPRDEEVSRLFRLVGRVGLLRPALEVYGAVQRMPRSTPGKVLG
jgi:glycosyltransferase involved in cell wall biosynthesis